MTFKLRAHHDLNGIKVKFANPQTREIKGSALRGAAALDMGVEEIVAVVADLETSDFISSSTAHNPKNSRVWHDTYRPFHADRTLYLKFAGETLVDVALVSFKDDL